MQIRKGFYLKITCGRWEPDQEGARLLCLFPDVQAPGPTQAGTHPVCSTKERGQSGYLKRARTNHSQTTKSCLPRVPNNQDEIIADYTDICYFCLLTPISPFGNRCLILQEAPLPCVSPRSPIHPCVPPFCTGLLDAGLGQAGQRDSPVIGKEIHLFPFRI